jgi:protein involved in polysaccharide export with SLBB domain
MVRKNPEINDQRAVSLEGEWNLPGVYSLSTRYDKLKVIFNQAQGLSPFADPNGIMVLRPVGKVTSSIADEMTSDSTEANLLSTVQKKPTEQEYDTIAIQINATSVKGLNFALQDGDRVLALEGSNSIRITGAVQKQTFVMHRQGRRAKYYIRSSGGFDAAALKSRTYVLFQNGQTRSTLNYGLVRIYPRVAPGAQVVVPENLKYGMEKQRVDPAQVAIVTSLLGFLTTTTITILQLIQ